MTPRRLLPFLVVFLVLAATYGLLTWRQGVREAREQEAKKLFAVKAGEITALALKRGQEEISLVKTGQEWQIIKPVKAAVDPVTFDSLLATLAHLEKMRDLGAAKDLPAFGLTKPGLVVEFTAQGKPHRLAIGGKTPGDQGYYALKDQEAELLTLSASNKESLDRPLIALRDKTLLTFAPDKVTALKIKTGATLVDLEKTGPRTWRWVGRERFPVRRDRAEALVRQLHFAQAKEFVAEPPRDLRAYGLAPQPAMEVAVLQGKARETLALGAKHQNDYYARKVPGGPVVLVDQNLMLQISKSLASLEDRRLWPGQITEVQKVVWGTPPKLWVGVKDKDFFKITGPEKQELRQPTVQVEMALVRLQQLESSRRPSKGAAPTGAPGYILELYDGSGKPLFRMEKLGKPARGEIQVLARRGDQVQRAWTSQAAYGEWQASMSRLTSPKKK
jgi:hypothetical protein